MAQDRDDGKIMKARKRLAEARKQFAEGMPGLGIATLGGIVAGLGGTLLFVAIMAPSIAAIPVVVGAVFLSGGCTLSGLGIGVQCAGRLKRLYAASANRDATLSPG
jgi:hypothetical protein